MAGTEQETAPLLRDCDGARNTNENGLSSHKNVDRMKEERLAPLHKILLFVALLLLLLSSIFLGLFMDVQHKLVLERANRDVGLPSTVCLTPECIILSASILSSLDSSQDPCENFYEFVNGGWLRAHPLPADKGGFGQFEALAQDNERVIQRILEDTSSSLSAFTNSEDNQLLSKLRGFYSSCMDEGKLDERGHEPLMIVINNIRRIFRGKEDSEDLTAALAYMHSQGLGALFSFDFEGDVGVDPNYMVLWFSQPALGLPSKEYYEEENMRNVYQHVIQRILLSVSKEDEEVLRKRSGDSSLLVEQTDVWPPWPPWPFPPWGGGGGDDKDEGGKKPVNKTERIYELAKKVVDFEGEIARASLDFEVLLENPIATYNPTSISNLALAFPQIRFQEYFTKLAPKNVPDRVILTHPPYVQSLSALLEKTPADVLEAYLITRAGLLLSPYLGMNTEAWQAQQNLAEKLSGIKKGAVGDRAEYCVSQVEQHLGFAAGRYFVNDTLTGDSIEKAFRITTNVAKSFQQSLNKIDWMDEQSAKAASEKAEALHFDVGYPLFPNTTEPSSLIEYYSLVTGDEDKFFENVLSGTVSDQARHWNQLGTQRNPDAWGVYMSAWKVYPSMVDACINPPANWIAFPAGILRPPFFHEDWPGYLVYGAFGFAVSHEITHEFDSAGRLYNQEGKLQQWWTNSTSEGFQAKQDCIIEQFSEYTIDDGKGGKIHVNGNLTSTENIGDSGLIQAYRAWKAQYDTSYEAGNEYLLPGLPYSRDQLFFISFARIWAKNTKAAALIQQVRTDPHSPNNFRVDGTVSNIPEFAEAFNCSAQARLNPPPEKRCIFWGRS